MARGELRKPVNRKSQGLPGGSSLESLVGPEISQAMMHGPKQSIKPMGIAKMLQNLSLVISTKYVVALSGKVKAEEAPLTTHS
jgi:hypothetical protein